MCIATTKNGTPCKNAPALQYCAKHAATAPESAPIISLVNPLDAPESAPIILEDATMKQDETTAPALDAPAPAKESKADRARKHYESRQRGKRQQIAASAMTTNQKETARMLLARESQDAAPIIRMDVARDDETIMAFDLALKNGDRHMLAIKPSDYDTRPRWLDEKTWKKARRAFNTLYARDGAGAFEKDMNGRLIMPLPMTPARYMGAVISGDINTVLRYAGGWRESDDGTFAMLARMDGVAPIIASVYRAGAGLNRMALALDKAQEKLDASDVVSRESLATKRDMARVARDLARGAFVSAYMDAVNSAESLDASARAIAAGMLAAFATAPESEDVQHTDLVA